MITNNVKISGYLIRFTGLFLISAVTTFVGFGCSSTVKNPWRDVTHPKAEATKVFGSHSAGCLVGAKSLYADGPGYRVMRVSRKRFYGHPTLVQLINEVGRKLEGKKMSPMLLGDASQARGGPMLSGHASHQTGLDIDVWYSQLKDTGKAQLSLDDRENLHSPSVLSNGDLNVSNWTKEKKELVKLWAENDTVERVFVTPKIKQDLCTKDPKATWIWKVRPWWGHDDHFHVRLRCPSNQPECNSTADPIEGNGCDETLAWWFSDEAKEKALAMAKQPAPSPKLPKLPASCEAVLND